MSRKTDVVILGMGYIGLPTAALLTESKLFVHGVDIDPKIVSTINKGRIHIAEPGLEQAISKAVAGGYLKASLFPIEANTYLIVVPTPFKENNEPDISFVEAATRSIIPLLKNNDLFIIESTSPVGTTDKMMELIYDERPELVNKIFMAYCPERVLPGNVMQELICNDRVIGGINQASTDRAISFYQKFVKGGLHSTTAKTAEMCKLVENSSRDVQIAFANELSMICHKSGIDVWELIELANKHPRVNILFPACGVGGHCIAVDPYFILSDYNKEAKLIKTARQVNNFKPLWCVERINNQRHEFKIEKGAEAKIAFMGLAFKPNIDDLRGSPAVKIIHAVLNGEQSKSHFIVEPNIDRHPDYKLTSYEEATQKADILVFLVAHDEFMTFGHAKEKIILDFCGVLSK